MILITELTLPIDLETRFGYCFEPKSLLILSSDQALFPVKKTHQEPRIDTGVTQSFVENEFRKLRTELQELRSQIQDLFTSFQKSLVQTSTNDSSESVKKVLLPCTFI